MRIVIVGAGIAGLTLATALARSGSSVVLLDQSTEAQPVGAGLQLAPNAALPLQRLGLGDALTKTAVRPEGQDILRWDDGTLAHSTPMGVECERRYGVPLYTLLRSDLHRILRERVPAESIRRGRYVTEVLENSDGVTLRCADGQEVHGDVAIGADGIHSIIRGKLNTERHGTTNRVLYRGLLPTERVPELVAEPRIRIWLGTDAHFSCYPVSSGAQISFNAAVPANTDRPESWSTQGRVSDLKRAFTGWSPAVHTVISAAEWIGNWVLSDRAPVARWHQGRVALMGDAAHPMLPFFAQGANQAIEDAIVLASCLRTATAFTVNQALARYAALRSERTQRVNKVARDLTYSLAEFGDDPEQYEAIITRTEHAKADWVYGYDADAPSDTAPLEPGAANEGP